MIDRDHLPGRRHRLVQPQGPAWRLSTTLPADFCIEALEEALGRYGQPEIFNSD